MRVGVDELEGVETDDAVEFEDEVGLVCGFYGV